MAASLDPMDTLLADVPLSSSELSLRAGTFVALVAALQKPHGPGARISDLAPRGSPIVSAMKNAPLVDGYHVLNGFILFNSPGASDVRQYVLPLEAIALVACLAVVSAFCDKLKLGGRSYGIITLDSVVARAGDCGVVTNAAGGRRMFAMTRTMISTILCRDSDTAPSVPRALFFLDALGADIERLVPLAVLGAFVPVPLPRGLWPECLFNGGEGSHAVVRAGDAKDIALAFAGRYPESEDNSWWKFNI